MKDELTGELKAAVEKAAFARASHRAWLRVTGSDATRWLNGMVTNSVQALQPSEGNYNFVLNAQGRIQGDCLIYREPDPAEPAAFLIATTDDQAETLLTLLDRFIIMDDVELTLAYQGEQSLVLIGPDAGQHAAALALSTPGPLRLVHAMSAFGPVVVFNPLAKGVPRLEVRCAPEIADALADALRDAGVAELGAGTFEQLRVLEGVPRFGTDIRERDLPQETAQAEALHFAKGCYVGQEIVERIRSRGQVHRQLTPFLLEGAFPDTMPAPLQAGEKAAGELTSVVAIPTADGNKQIALGYARREFLETHTTLTYAGGTAHPRAAGRLS